MEPPPRSRNILLNGGEFDGDESHGKISETNHLNTTQWTNPRLTKKGYNFFPKTPYLPKTLEDDSFEAKGLFSEAMMLVFREASCATNKKTWKKMCNAKKKAAGPG